MVIRNETIKYTSNKKKKVRNKERNLIDDIQKLENKHSIQTDDRINAELKFKKLGLENLYDKNINGQILRAKAVEVEHNEKNINTLQISRKDKLKRKFYIN